MLLYILLCLLVVSTALDPPPTCALNYPCPPPTWDVVWQLNRSTICQPANNGYFMAPKDQPWGIVSLDWANAMSYWLQPDRNTSTCEGTNMHNAMMIKQVSPTTRVFIYHNLELALQWLESQRPYMYDPTQKHIFLQYLDGMISS